MSIFSENTIQNEEDISRFAALEKLQKLMFEASIAVDERSKNLGSFLVSPSIYNPEKVFFIGYDCDTSLGSLDLNDETKWIF